jgi:[acyl-carrier-protein] S-malonyltransferase
MSLALIFPGQGSQYVGMAKELTRAEPVARRVLEHADDILGFRLSTLMADGPEEELTATNNAQPALLAHSIAALHVVSSRLGPVSFAAGHSLGEFSAHVAAGTVSFEDAITLVRLRGELMFGAGRCRPGAMAAVLGLGDDQIEAVCDRVDTGVCVPANYNTAQQVVISGDVAAVERGMALANEAGAKKVVRLNVSGAFHSPLMEPAAQGLREHLGEVDFHDPDFSVVANASAEAVTSGDEARELLIEQLTSAVRWSQSISKMTDAGVDRFIELGPGNVLCGLNRRNARGVPCTAMGEPDDFVELDEGRGR